MITTALVFALSLLPGQVANQNKSQPPANYSDADKWTRVGSPIWGSRQASSTTNRTVQNDTSWSVVASDRLFAWGGLVVAMCEVDTTICATQSSTVTITAAGYVLDGFGPDGLGSCYKAEANIPRDIMVSRVMFPTTSAIGSRAGVCTNTGAEGVPCRIATDCKASGGTCSTVNVNEHTPVDRQKGAFLKYIAGSTSTCFFTEER